MSAPEIFNRKLRRLRRDRAAPGFPAHAFVVDHIIESLLDRLDLVSRRFDRALDLGCHDGRLTKALRGRGIEVVSADAGYRFAKMAGGIQCDEDRLPFADASFDLVISAGVFDQVNDLPGALTLIGRILKPDGLLLAGFTGAGSLPMTRSAVMAADIVHGGAVAPRIHPQIDVRAAGDLLSRAGFVLTVADGETLSVRYSNPFRILSDLRGMAATNLIDAQPARHFNRQDLATIAESLASQAERDGAVTERFELVFMTGWSPGPNQPQPARRGSGGKSLADALKPAPFSDRVDITRPDKP